METVLWSCLEILINIYQGIIYAYFIGYFLSFRESTNKVTYYICCGGGQALLITLFNYTTVFESIASVFYTAELFVFACIMLSGNMIKKLFACVLPLFTGSAITVGILNFFASINELTISEIVSNRGSVRLIILFSIQLLYYISFKLLLKLFKIDNNCFGPYDWGVMIAVMISSITLAGITHHISIKIGNYEVRAFLNISIMVLLILNIFIYHLINSHKKKSELEKELERVRMQEYYQRQYIDRSKQQYDSIRKIKHDTMNSFLTICTLIEEKDYSRAYSFTKEHTDMLASVQTFISTHNSIANAVINSKLSYASAIGIRSKCLSVCNISGIKDTDLCSILSNTLDNAITACLQIPDEHNREISVEINCEDEHYYSFVIKNSINGSVLENNPELVSTKLNKSEHGYGIQIIKEIAEKYGGRVDFYEEYDQFCCRIDLISNLIPLA